MSYLLQHVRRALLARGGQITSASPGDEPVDDPIQLGTDARTEAGDTPLVITVPVGGVPAGATILVAYFGSGGDGLSVADTRSNPYTEDLEHTDGLTRFLSIYSARVTTPLLAGDTITVTYTGHSGAKRASACYVPNLALTGLVDDTSAANGNSDTPSSGDLTTTVAHTFWYAVCGYLNTSAFTPGAGFTELSEEGASVAKLAVEHYRPGSITTASAGGTLGAAEVWLMGAVAYKGE